MDEQSLVPGIHGDYLPTQWDGINRSGIRSVGTTVIVLMDEASPKTRGGIILSDSEIERKSACSVSGVLVDVAPGAFLTREDGSLWEDERPKPGDRVSCSKYAGNEIPGRDGRRYRQMDYKNIGGIYESDEEYRRRVEAAEAEQKSRAEAA